MTESMFDAHVAPAGPPLLERWFAPMTGPDSYLRARWLFLRCLGIVFFSAFESLWFQIHGLIGPRGILPAGQYLAAAKSALGPMRAFWLVPSLLWLDAGDAMLTAVVAAGLIASVALILNVWPRAAIVIAGIAFLSFVAAASEFSSYQSDGMLLEAAFLSFFFAPRGLRPGLGVTSPPSRAAHFLLLYEWFRIYFESGLVKLLSGEEQWRNLTAMDKYYENGPLPTWLGWYVQQWPHSFHAASAAATLIIELFVAWLIFLPKRSRVVCFFITTPLQIGIILTANYAFLNYLVLFLGVLLLDDRFFRNALYVPTPEPAPASPRPSRVAAFVLTTHFLTSTLMFFWPSFPTAVLVAPSRIANSYGLFAVMTRARYEVEFQGSMDGVNWTAYPFAYKPQDPMRRPEIFAPYQPRFDWNLWFASLGSIDENGWVMNVESRLLENSPDVLRLFAANPFAKQPPKFVKAVLWQYWFTTPAERKQTGAWWRRDLRGDYAPVLSAR